jgi:N-hydroxyarylamine O-acetyltransferase
VAGFSLDAYLDRIGWTGSVEPTLETLTALSRAHIASIPFENLDVLLGRGIRIDLNSIHNKLVVARRGGYCFEHGTLFQAAIETIGFTCHTHAARVLTVLPKAEAPRTHMFISVALGDRTYVVDPGFGGHGPVVPVPVVAGDDVRNGFDRHRLVRSGDEWLLEAEIGGEMKPLWTATFEALQPVDFLLANHYTATYPESPFVTKLVMRALTPGGRTTVVNREMRIVRDGTTEIRTLADRAELRELLTEHFGFDLPEIERLRIPAVPEWR